jgi:hypothetical protein
MKTRGVGMNLAAISIGSCLTAAFVLTAPTPARAGHAHTIQTANSPSTGLPVTGGGSWIVNRANAYYIGRLPAGSTFDDEVTDGNNWHYGRAFGNIQMCGWAMPGSMGAYRGDIADSCSAATMNQLSHRRYVGRDFNAPAHAETDGTPVPAYAGCGLYYNYFYGTDFTSNYGHPADYAGGISSWVSYRFTSNDGNGAVVRDPVLGWGFTYVGCVQRPAALYNDDD